jgi:hypothetical protein
VDWLAIVVRTWRVATSGSRRVDDRFGGALRPYAVATWNPTGGR